MNAPVVYYKPGCPFALRLRATLTLHGVPHRSVRFRDDEDGAAAVRALNDGNEMSPTVQVAGRWLTNPRWREVRDMTKAVDPSGLHLTHPGGDRSADTADASDKRSRSLCPTL